MYNTLGSAWLSACREIRNSGERGRDGTDLLRERLHLCLKIRHPNPKDPILLRHVRPEVLEWMRSNFRDQKLVPELGNSPSYAVRLRNHRGRDQIGWVVEKLKKKPESKSATITTLLGDDEEYVPCVSLLDFKIRHRRLLLTVACRSIDAGVKLPANLIALAELQAEVAERVGVPPGPMVLWIASAHIYERDLPAPARPRRANALRG